MTTNQTIDGAPRDYVLRITPEAHSVMLGMVEHCLNVRACMGMDEGFKDFETEEEHGFVKELRALLDAPPKDPCMAALEHLERFKEVARSGDVSGVIDMGAELIGMAYFDNSEAEKNVESANSAGHGCVCLCNSDSACIHEHAVAAQPQGEPVAILSGPDDSVCWTQDSKPKELRKQVVLIEHADLLRLQELAYGAAGRVYQTRWNRLGEWEEWKTVSQEQYQRSEGRLFERRIVYAKQPAPVAVVLPERFDLPHRDEFESADQYAAATGEAKSWNACLDELKRLNPSL